MKGPSEPGHYWVLVRDPVNPTWTIAHVNEHGVASWLGNDIVTSVDDDDLLIVQWGARLPEPSLPNEPAAAHVRANEEP